MESMRILAENGLRAHLQHICSTLNSQEGSQAAELLCTEPFLWESPGKWADYSTPWLLHLSPKLPHNPGFSSASDWAGCLCRHLEKDRDFSQLFKVSWQQPGFLNLDLTDSGLLRLFNYLQASLPDRIAGPCAPPADEVALSRGWHKLMVKETGSRADDATLRNPSQQLVRSIQRSREWQRALRARQPAECPSSSFFNNGFSPHLYSANERAFLLNMESILWYMPVCRSRSFSLSGREYAADSELRQDFNVKKLLGFCQALEVCLDKEYDNPAALKYNGEEHFAAKMGMALACTFLLSQVAAMLATAGEGALGADQGFLCGQELLHNLEVTRSERCARTGTVAPGQ